MLPLILGPIAGAALGGVVGYFNTCSTGTCPLLATWWRGAIYGAVMGFIFATTLTSRR